MKISGVLIREQEENAEPTLHLEIYVNGGEKVIVNYTDFRSYLSDDVSRPSEQTEIGLGKKDIDISDIPTPLPVDTAATKKALDFLLANICTPEEHVTADDELLIESDSYIFLRLPWEVKVDQTKTAVFRQIPKGTSSKPKEEAAKAHAKFLILQSYAHRVGEKNLGDLRDDTKKEITAIVDDLIEKSGSELRVGKITVVKHGTKEELGRVDFNTLNYVHIIMHGDEDGNLCLEKTEIPENADLLSRDELLSMLKRAGVNGVLFFFLSFCYSAGGRALETNLSYELIKEGIAEYVVGYAGGVGNRTALDFAKDFYPYLASGRSIKDSFAEASKKRIRSYTPLLYGRFLETDTQIAYETA